MGHGLVTGLILEGLYQLGLGLLCRESCDLFQLGHVLTVGFFQLRFLDTDQFELSVQIFANTVCFVLFFLEVFSFLRQLFFAVLHPQFLFFQLAQLADPFSLDLGFHLEEFLFGFQQPVFFQILSFCSSFFFQQTDVFLCSAQHIGSIFPCLFQFSRAFAEEQPAQKESDQQPPASTYQYAHNVHTCGFIVTGWCNKGRRTVCQVTCQLCCCRLFCK